MEQSSQSCCDREVDRVAAVQRRFLGALLELGEFSYSADSDDEFYQRLIERAVEAVPGAEGGSILVAVEATFMFRFAAAVGFNLEQLQQHTLDKRHFFRDSHSPGAKIVHDLEVESRSQQVTDWLNRVGRLSEICSNISAPVIVDDATVAFISLDNFSCEGAFGEAELEMVTVLAQFIADLQVRRRLEADLRAERESFRHLATHDGLTGLANRRHIESKLHSSVEAAGSRRQPSAVLFLDLDDFKNVNDTYGHDYGDRVLRAVADTISSAVRTSDLVGRWGGDEFIVLPARLDSPGEALSFADRVLAGFESPLKLDGGGLLEIGVSIGVGWTSDSQLSAQELLRRADEALYEAKPDVNSRVKLRGGQTLPAHV